MADDTKFVTMYSSKSDKQIRVPASKAAIDEAKTKGWLTAPAPKSPVSGSGVAGQGGDKMGGSGGDWSEDKSSFGAAFMKGANPFHQTPDSVPSSGSTMKDMGMDMLNLRESMNMRNQGNQAGRYGMMAGTAASFAGPEIVRGVGKGLEAAGAAARAAKFAPRISEAAKQATNTAKSLRAGIGEARLSEEIIQPLRKALDSHFEPLHKALEQYSFPMSTKATQLIRRMSKADDIPAVRKLADELMQKSGFSQGIAGFDYREADKLVSELRQLSGRQAAHWTPQVRALAEELDKGIDGVAKLAGQDKQRTALKAMYKEMMDVRNTLAATAKTKAPRIRALFDMLSGAFSGEAYGGMRGGVTLGHENAIKPSEVGMQAAKNLASKLGVSEKELLMKKYLSEKVGKAAKVGATGVEAGGPALRALMTYFGQ